MHKAVQKQVKTTVNLGGGMGTEQMGEWRDGEFALYFYPYLHVEQCECITYFFKHFLKTPLSCRFLITDFRNYQSTALGTWCGRLRQSNAILYLHQ